MQRDARDHARQPHATDCRPEQVCVCVTAAAQSPTVRQHEFELDDVASDRAVVVMVLAVNVCGYRAAE